MFSSYIFLAVSLLNILSDFHVSSCVTNCTDKPVFTPSRLVVKHGDPTSATCSVCQSACHNTTFGLEKSVGNDEITGTTISWEIDRLTEWGTSLLCYYNDDDSGDQCCSTLPVTVYKPPDSVSISFYNHTGPMFEGRQYTLLCTVHNVAPVKNVIVTFYRGKTPLGRPQSFNNTQNKPVNEIYTLIYTPSKEDDGAQYWCEAQLDLGPEGPQPPPVVKSQNINTTVYYKPRLEVSSHSNNITITKGHPLHLNCSAVGNPTPSYTWTLPLSNHRQPGNSNTLTIESVDFEHQGTYTCSVGNIVGDVNVLFHVEVRANYIPYIIAAVLIAVAVVFTCASVVYIHYYKHNRMGQYNMKDVFRLHKQLIPSSSA